MKWLCGGLRLQLLSLPLSFCMLPKISADYLLWVYSLWVLCRLFLSPVYWWTCLVFPFMTVTTLSASETIQIIKNMLAIHQQSFRIFSNFFSGKFQTTRKICKNLSYYSSFSFSVVMGTCLVLLKFFSEGRRIVISHFHLHLHDIFLFYTSNIENILFCQLYPQLAPKK